MKKEEAMKLAEQGLAELNQALQNGHSETLTRYLDLLSRFHRYSFNNVLLIAAQRPDAMHVAGFHTWRKLGRCVRKGEHGIGILAPMIYRQKNEANHPSDDPADSLALAGFRIVHVFDVSQTDGDDLPELATIQGDPGDRLSRLEEAIRKADIEIEYGFAGYGALGASTGGRIIIQPNLPPAETFGILVHEFSHLCCERRYVEFANLSAAFRSCRSS